MANHPEIHMFPNGTVVSIRGKASPEELQYEWDHREAILRWKEYQRSKGGYRHAYPLD